MLLTWPRDNWHPNLPAPVYSNVTCPSSILNYVVGFLTTLTSPVSVFYLFKAKLPIYSTLWWYLFYLVMTYCDLDVALTMINDADPWLTCVPARIPASATWLSWLTPLSHPSRLTVHWADVLLIDDNAMSAHCITILFSLLPPAYVVLVFEILILLMCRWRRRVPNVTLS